MHEQGPAARPFPVLGIGLQQNDREAVPPQRERGRQAHGSGAHDQDRGHARAPSARVPASIRAISTRFTFHVTVSYTHL